MSCGISIDRKPLPTTVWEKKTWQKRVEINLRIFFNFLKLKESCFRYLNDSNFDRLLCLLSHDWSMYVIHKTKAMNRIAFLSTLLKDFRKFFPLLLYSFEIFQFSNGIQKKCRAFESSLTHINNAIRYFGLSWQWIHPNPTINSNHISFNLPLLIGIGIKWNLFREQNTI